MIVCTGQLNLIQRHVQASAGCTNIFKSDFHVYKQFSVHVLISLLLISFYLEPIFQFALLEPQRRFGLAHWGSTIMQKSADADECLCFPTWQLILPFFLSTAEMLLYSLSCTSVGPFWPSLTSFCSPLSCLISFAHKLHQNAAAIESLSLRGRQPVTSKEPFEPNFPRKKKLGAANTF